MKKFLVCLLLLVAGFFYNWHLFVTSLVNFDQGNISILPGDTLSTIEGQLLEGNSAFYPELMYRVYRNMNPIVIKPGTRHFAVGTSFSDAYGELDKDIGPVKVRLPEGETAKKFATILEESGVASRRDLETCFSSCKGGEWSLYRSSSSGFEGFLFPDTYLLNTDSKPEFVLETLLDNFSVRIEPLIQKYSTFLNTHELRDVVIMASLLEREARNLQDKRMVAGILYKRLKIGMRLDVDATVLYVKGDWRAPITVDDLASNSPYNTRKFGGLPPGPIANPSLESLEAAMSPIASNYLYYLNGASGETYYAATLEGHVQNKWKYL